MKEEPLLWKYKGASQPAISPLLATETPLLFLSLLTSRSHLSLYRCSGRWLTRILPPLHPFSLLFPHRLLLRLLFNNCHFLDCLHLSSYPTMTPFIDISVYRSLLAPLKRSLTTCRALPSPRGPTPLLEGRLPWPIPTLALAPAAIPSINQSMRMKKQTSRHRSIRKDLVVDRSHRLYLRQR